MTAEERSVFKNSKIMFGGSGLLLLWGLFFRDGVFTALDIWLGNDIFNHCLLVIPGAFYLIYLKRLELPSELVRPTFWPIPLLVGCFLLYLVGAAGDVQLFMHVACFAALPIMIWMYVGNQIALRISFPLFFMLFSIPFGEEFVPFLQEITADWSVILLNLTGVPIFRSGLYIEIPQGRFLVAEACSGISFFIASVVIGSLYAYLNIFSWKRKILFVIISIVFPVVANAIRVYGIILTGYLTDMEHAVGADHLIYGWIFFSLVIVCLLFIGELVREKAHVKTTVKNLDKYGEELLSNKLHVSFLLSVLFVVIVFQLWLTVIQGQLKTDTKGKFTFRMETVSQSIDPNNKQDWLPKFKNVTAEHFGKVIGENDIDIYAAWYAKGQGELISSLNRLYHEKDWTLESRKSMVVNGHKLSLSIIVNPGSKRLLTYWYVIDGDIYTDKRFAKLMEIKNILLGHHKGSGIVSLSMHSTNERQKEDRVYFEKYVLATMEPLTNSFAVN